jgi:hypothetical protein
MEDTREAERVYDADLRRFLFSEGISMPFSQPGSASGLSDAVADLHTEDPLVCEVKIRVGGVCDLDGAGVVSLIFFAYLASVHGGVEEPGPGVGQGDPRAITGLDDGERFGTAKGPVLVQGLTELAESTSSVRGTTPGSGEELGDNAR